MIRKTTWIIVLIFAVLLAAVFLWQRSKDEKAAEAIQPSLSAWFTVPITCGREGRIFVSIVVPGKETGGRVDDE